MTLNEATALAQKQAEEFGVAMIVVRTALSEDAGGYECCAEMYRETLYPDHHRQFWAVVGRWEAAIPEGIVRAPEKATCKKEDSAPPGKASPTTAESASGDCRPPRSPTSSSRG